MPGSDGVCGDSASKPASIEQKLNPTQAKVSVNRPSSTNCNGVMRSPKTSSICQNPSALIAAVPPNAISRACITRRLAG